MALSRAVAASFLAPFMLLLLLRSHAPFNAGTGTSSPFVHAMLPLPQRRNSTFSTSTRSPPKKVNHHQASNPSPFWSIDRLVGKKTTVAPVQTAPALLGFSWNATAVGQSVRSFLQSAAIWTLVCGSFLAAVMSAKSPWSLLNAIAIFFTGTITFYMVFMLSVMVGGFGSVEARNAAHTGLVASAVFLVGGCLGAWTGNWIYVLPAVLLQGTMFIGNKLRR